MCPPSPDLPCPVLAPVPQCPPYLPGPRSPRARPGQQARAAAGPWSQALQLVPGEELLWRGAAARWVYGLEGGREAASPQSRSQQPAMPGRSNFTPCRKTWGHPPARGSPWSCAPGACPPGQWGHLGHVASPWSFPLTAPGKPPVGETWFDLGLSKRHRGSCPWPPRPDPRLLGMSPGSACPVLAEGTEPKAVGTRWQKKLQQSRVAEGLASSGVSVV